MSSRRAGLLEETASRLVHSATIASDVADHADQSDPNGYRLAMIARELEESLKGTASALLIIAAQLRELDA